jgi:hypothetical protein
VVLEWLRTQRVARQDLAEVTVELPPYGSILHLRRPSPTAMLKRDAVAGRLGRFSDGPRPYVGILLDLDSTEYYFSSGDLGALVASTASWNRGATAPCAIVLTGRPAAQLQALLDITKLSTLHHIHIVDSVEAGRRHLELHLRQRA